MMRCDIYYGVSFAQSLYLLLWQNGCSDQLVDRVFSQAEDISVSYGTAVSGRERVRSFYERLHEQMKQNKSFVRLDMPATPSIIVDKEHLSATGMWTTMSVFMEKAQAGAKVRCAVGQFTNTFVCENNIWCIQSIDWKPLLSLEPWQYRQDENLERYLKDPGKWLEALPDLSEISMDGVTKDTMDTLYLRNYILGAFQSYNRSGTHGLEGICAAMDARQHMEKTFDACSFILATSPVIRIQEETGIAEAFFSVTLINKISETEVFDSRGSIYMQLKKTKESFEQGFEVTAFDWYPYANLEPWKLEK